MLFRSIEKSTVGHTFSNSITFRNTTKNINEGEQAVNPSENKENDNLMLDTSHLLRTTKLEGKKRDRSRLKSLGEEINFDGDLDQHKITTNAQNFKFSKKQGLFNGDIIQESNRFIENRRFRQDITPILKEGIVKTPI